jgi:hypothetical protein
MLKIALRSANAIFAVAVAIVISSRYGESDLGKLYTVLITTGVVACFEALTIWLPKRFRWARRILDPRSSFAGVWLQQNVVQLGKDGAEHASNNFAIFTIDYRKDRDNYAVDGTAYDVDGNEFARWDSTPVAHFDVDGTSMTYLWTGSITKKGHPEGDSERTADSKRTDDSEKTGFAHLTQNDGDGRGRVDHLAEDVSLRFNILRITTQWLKANNLGQFSAKALKGPSERDRFAAVLANSGLLPKLKERNQSNRAPMSQRKTIGN